jgi:pectate lyase-like protein
MPIAGPAVATSATGQQLALGPPGPPGSQGPPGPIGTQGPAGLPSSLTQDVLAGSNGVSTVVGIQTVPVSSTPPTTGEALVYNGSEYAPAAVASQTTIALSNGLNSNVATGGQTSLRFGSYTASVILGGISPSSTPSPGQVFPLSFTIAQPIYIRNLDVDSSSTSQIITGTGGDVLLPPGQTGQAWLVWDATIQKFRLLTNGVQTVRNVTPQDFGATGNGSTDDTAAFQAAMTFAFDSGFELFVPPGTYCISSELQTPLSGGTAFGFRMRGALGFAVNNGFVQSCVTIKATASMRSCYAALGSCVDIQGVCFNANGFATYGSYIDSEGFATFRRCYACLAIIDGWYVYEADNATWWECGADSNGTVYCSSAAVKAQYTKWEIQNADIAVVVPGSTPTMTTDATNAYKVVLSGAGAPDLTTLNIRKGDILRLAGGTSSSGPTGTPLYFQISGVVNSTTLFLANAPLPPTNTAYTEWAISVGDGLHAMAFQVGGEASGNLAMLSVHGGNYQGNACAGLSLGSEFAFSCAVYDAPLLSYNLATGLNAGCAPQTAASTGDFVQDNDGMICLGLFVGPAYFESNTGYQVMAGNCSDLFMTAGTCSPFLVSPYYGLQHGQCTGIVTQNSSYPFFPGLAQMVGIGEGASNLPSQGFADDSLGFQTILDTIPGSSGTNSTFQFNCEQYSSHVIEAPAVSGNVNLTATPTILPPSNAQITGGGNMIAILWNGNTSNSFTLNDNSVVAGTNLYLATEQVTVPPGGMIVLQYSASAVGWFELARARCGNTGIVTAQSSTYTVDAGNALSRTVWPDDTILCSGSAFNVTLPPPAQWLGRKLKVKATASSATTYTILPNSGETIDGASSYAITLKYGCVELTCDGTNWWVTAEYNGTVI